MIRIAYLSTAVSPPAPADLEAILTASRRNNADLGVTGLLCHHDGSFLQFLEGDDAVVDRLYARIALDPRHHSVLRLYREPVTERLFGDWSMALAAPDQVGAEHRRFCQALGRLEAGETEGHAQAVTPFLNAFRAWLRA